MTALIRHLRFPRTQEQDRANKPPSSSSSSAPVIVAAVAHYRGGGGPRIRVVTPPEAAKRRFGFTVIVIPSNDIAICLKIAVRKWL